MGMLNEIPFWGPISVGDLLKHPAGLGIKANPDSIPGIIGGGVGQLLMVATAGGDTGQSAPGGGGRVGGSR